MLFKHILARLNPTHSQRCIPSQQKCVPPQKISFIATQQWKHWNWVCVIIPRIEIYCSEHISLHRMNFQTSMFCAPCSIATTTKKLQKLNEITLKRFKWKWNFASAWQNQKICEIHRDEKHMKVHLEICDGNTRRNQQTYNFKGKLSTLIFLWKNFSFFRQ